MRYATILFLLPILAACEPRGLYEVADGDAILAERVEIGLSIGEVKRILAKNEVKYYEVTAERCGEAGDIYIYPENVCAGGPALRLTLSENARPFNPFYSPTMHAFLAFDERATFTLVRVSVQGGD